MGWGMAVGSTILLAAGGTGGHIFPAQAVAEKLRANGYEVHFATDARGYAHYDEIHTEYVHRVAAATIFSGRLWMRPFKLIGLVVGVFQSLWLMWRLRPMSVVGFGGYPCFAPCVAGLLTRRPVLVHEQNAILGRANKWLAALGAYIAKSYQTTLGISPYAMHRTYQTGNPVRMNVVKAAHRNYKLPRARGRFHLLVTGGSQGARIFGEVIPDAIALLPASLRNNMHITHQSHNAQMRIILDSYSNAGVSADIRSFFDDLPRRMRDAHIMVARAGATTIAELTMMGTPSILVPLPSAIDQDQMRNAQILAAIGAARIMRQEHFVAERLASVLEELMTDYDRLKIMSQAALQFKQADATTCLAACITSLAHSGPIRIDRVVRAKKSKIIKSKRAA